MTPTDSPVLAPPTPPLPPAPPPARTSRPPRRRLIAIVATLAVIVVVAVCVLALAGRVSDDSVQSGGSTASVERESQGEESLAPSASPLPRADTGAESGDSAAAPDAGGAQDTAPDIGEQTMINTGNVALRSDDVDRTAFDIDKLVNRYRGQVTSSQTSNGEYGDGSDGAGSRFASITLQVPASSFTTAFADLKKLGTLISADSTSEDVGAQIIDTAVRVRAQERSLRRIEVLLDRAESLSDIVAIESQLTQRQAELDSLKRQQARLADQTAMSTISISVERSDRAVAPEPKDTDEDAGFLSGLGDGWHALTGLGTSLATGLGAMLPFAGVLAVVLLPVWLLVRRRRSTSTPGAPSTPAASA